LLQPGKEAGQEKPGDTVRRVAYAEYQVSRQYLRAQDSQLVQPGVDCVWIEGHARIVPPQNNGDAGHPQRGALPAIQVAAGAGPGEGAEFCHSGNRGRVCGSAISKVHQQEPVICQGGVACAVAHCSSSAFFVRTAGGMKAFGVICPLHGCSTFVQKPSVNSLNHGPHNICTAAGSGQSANFQCWRAQVVYGMSIRIRTQTIRTVKIWNVQRLQWQK
jgi:hypothetical protein